MFKKLMIVVMAFGLASCAAKKTIYKGVEPISELKCNVQVFTSIEEAQAEGEFEELCSISGAPGVPTTSQKAAVNKIKDRVCECGADKAYVVRTEKGFLGTRKASIIGFRFTNKKSSKTKKQ